MNKWLQTYVGAVVLIAAVVTAQNVWALGKTDWAAWVQAIGSITAIVGAFEVGRRQADAARTQALEMVEVSRRSQRSAVAAIVQNASAQAQSVAGLMKGMNAPHFALALTVPIHAIPEAMASLAAVPLHELGSYQAVIQITSLQAALTRLNAAIEEFKGSKDPLAQGVYSNCYSVVVPTAEMIEYHANAACAALGVTDLS